MYKSTTTLKKILKQTAKVRGNAGGTSSGKTIAILLYLIDKAQSDKKPTLTSIFAESIPVLKRGVLRDFTKIMKAHNYWKEASYSRTDRIYTFENGSQIEFLNADEPEKFKGSRRDRAFLNEANNILFETYQQIEVRTKEFVFLDWNPTNEFWFYTELKDTKDVDFLITTYKDNEGLDESIVKSIEAKKHLKQWWRVYGLGLLGEVEGRIYRGWRELDTIPIEARLISRGLDFGYTNDPTAIVDIYYWNGAYILDELVYQKGLSNKEISEKLKVQDEQIMTICDSAEPKSIDELRTYGIDAVATVKGAGSIITGIQWIQAQKIFYTRRSVNLKKEYNNYMWKFNKRLGTWINEPEDSFNHLGDSIRYGLSTRIFSQRRAEIVMGDVEETQNYL